MQVITPSDEQLHTPEDQPHWQESYYFNWTTLDGRSFGLARLGYRPSKPDGDGVVVLMRDGKRELVYGAVNQAVAPLDTLDAAAGLRVGNLTFQLLEPLRQWRILLTGRNEIDLTWTALASPFDFAADGADGADIIAHRHFEHPGTVTGRVRIGGVEHQVSGFGTRDKSWGPRDWGTVVGWEWISAQFGPALAFTLAQTIVDGHPAQSGFLYRDGQCLPIDSFALNYVWGSAQVPNGAQITIIDGAGRRYDVTARAVTQVPLYKAGLMIQETHAAFETTLDGKVLSGGGILEHAWHADSKAKLTRLPQLLPVLKDALVSRFR